MRHAAWAVLALALLLAGCGLGPGKKLSGGAKLDVTRDFGQKSLYSTSVPQIRQGETVMRMLESKRAVKTKYGGAFVNAIDGLTASTTLGHSDWFYFVNGSEAPGSDYGTVTGTTQNNGQVVLTAAAGDVLTLRNHTSASTVTLPVSAGGSATNVNASLLIRKLA